MNGGGGDGGGGGGGEGGAGGAVPRVIVDAELMTGAGTCTVTPGPLFTIGSFGPPAMPVDDQGSFGSGTVSVSCSVVPSATGFDVKLQAMLSGNAGGSITVQGAVTDSGMQTGLDVVTTSYTNKFAQLDCTMTYDASSGGPAAGRIWGTVVCNKGVDLQKNQTCQITAQIRFENCAQQ
jgi:hypothetical protein